MMLGSGLKIYFFYYLAQSQNKLGCRKKTGPSGGGFAEIALMGIISTRACWSNLGGLLREGMGEPLDGGDQ